MDKKLVITWVLIASLFFGTVVNFLVLSAVVYKQNLLIDTVQTQVEVIGMITEDLKTRKGR